MLGLPLAGVVVAGLGSDWGIAIDAASFAVAALFFGLVRIPAVERAAPGGRSVLRDLIDGWQAFIARTWLWVVVAAFGVLNMAFAGGVTVLGPVVADETVGRRAWGFVLGAEAAGFLIGGLFALRLRMRRLLLFGVVCMLPLALPLFALAAHTSLPGLLVAFFVSGLGVEQFAVAWQTCVQRHVPPELLARLTAYDMLGSFIAIPLGEVAAGPVSHAIGVRPTLLALWAGDRGRRRRDGRQSECPQPLESTDGTSVASVGRVVRSALRPAVMLVDLGQIAPRTAAIAPRGHSPPPARPTWRLR